MPMPLNAGDIVRHFGTVIASAEDLTLTVVVPALSDTPVDDVAPETVSPLRWRPREGDRVVVYQRMGALRPENAWTWVGWAHDSGDTHLCPPWLDAGLVHLLGESGRVQVVLNDEDAPDGTPDTLGILQLGSRLADEPLVMGTAYRTHLETTLDLLSELIDALDAEAQSMAALDIQLGTWAALVSTATMVDGSALATAITNHGTALSTLRSAIKSAAASIQKRLVGPTTPTGNDQKSLIPDHLSDYVFTSKSPDPDPYTNESED